MSKIIEENKWCLYPDVLLRLAKNMEERNRLLPGEYDGGKEYAIPLRSSRSKEIFYEVIIREGPYIKEIFINVWHGAESKVRVYENGYIVRWGAWAVELMEALPKLIAEESMLAAQIEEGSYALENIVFDTTEKELLNNWGDSDAISRVINSRDRSGMPIHLLN